MSVLLCSEDSVSLSRLPPLTRTVCPLLPHRSLSLEGRDLIDSEMEFSFEDVLLSL